MNILDLEMVENDAEAGTIRDYLKALLLELWQEGESFSGKRPFGNSGWEYELYKTLVKHKVVEGTLDEFGDIDDFDDMKANKLIFDAIGAL